MRPILAFLAASMMVAALSACSEGDPGDTSGNAGGTGGSTAVQTGGAGGAAGGAGGATGTPTTGCEAESGEPVSFANDVLPVFQDTCGGTLSNCHFKALPSGGLSLKATAAYSALVDKKSKVSACNSRTLVVPGNVAESYFVDKLIYTGKPDICGLRMPYKKAKLSDAKMQTFVSWICQGAKND